MESRDGDQRRGEELRGHRSGTVAVAAAAAVAMSRTGRVECVVDDDVDCKDAEWKQLG